MNTVSILIICGFVYLLFVTWMFGKKGNNGKSETSDKSTPKSEPKAIVNEPEDEKTTSVENQKKEVTFTVPLVPKSNFSMADFQKAMTESMKAAMIYVLQHKPGEVTPDQVEFDDKEEENADKNSDTAVNAPLETEPDIDDVEPDNPSPPASGNSLEDIEAALNVAANANKATAEEKAIAGNVLSGMRDVVFIGKIMSANGKINDGVMACIAESIRREQKRKKKGSPSPKKKNKPIDVGGTLRDIDMIKRKKDEED